MLPIGIVDGGGQVQDRLVWKVGVVSALYFGGGSAMREIREKDDSWNVIFGALLAGVYSNRHRAFIDASIGCFFPVLLSGALDMGLNKRKSQTVPFPAKKMLWFLKTPNNRQDKIAATYTVVTKFIRNAI
jgi:hypothetical protein